MMRRVLVSVSFAITAAAIATRTGESASRAQSRQLVVHEWGTFTTVAGEDGRAIDWLPLGGPTDLPCFVEHFDHRPLVKVFGSEAPVAGFAAGPAALRAKVRMETPVLYFYGPRDTRANVRVRFPRGLMTEWYP